MNPYQQAYKQLNDAQRQAVDRTDGPVLVIAGPGTGKTQLLSTRIAHILATTDTLPENILCLTFTDAAALNMRERLSAMIGVAAYSVTISTYHAFGNDILKRYPEFFVDAAELEPADALKIDQVMRSVQASLPYSNSLKHEIFLRDIKSLLSDYKRALLTPTDVRAIVRANEDFTEEASQLVRTKIGAMPRITKASIGAYASLLDASAQLTNTTDLPVEPLSKLWTASLREAVETAQQTGKTTTLTAWKNRWLVKDGEGFFTVGGRETLRKQRSAADIYERYLAELTKQGLYDYDDMILQAIRGLESNDELRFTMQERYQYLLLDEFQDTNQAQLRLVQLLTDNPVNEQRPNVLAVGDDDQAIYAFQGADYSHMLEFYHHYKDVLVVPLTENYRSTPDILELGQAVSGQISERLHHNFPAINKSLTAAKTAEAGQISHHQFLTDVSQNVWVGQTIAQLIAEGLPANDIAILAPKHQQLESIVPFLREQGIAVHYEKRDDVLADPAITELLTMSRLVLAMAAQDDVASNAYWPQVLSLAFWQLPTSTIWELSWEAKSSNWTSAMMQNEALRPIALFFINLSLRVGREPLETSLDYLAGITTLQLNEPDLETYRAPFYEYYFGHEAPVADEPVSFWQLLSNLTVLRQRLQDYRAGNDATPTLADFLAFVAAHQAASIKVLNTNPYQESAAAVQLMTAYKSKGQEFSAVFVLALNDEVWGSRMRNQSSRIGIPENLRFIRYAGASEDERLRLLFVALTRAKSQLYLTNFSTNFSGTNQSQLKYLLDTPQASAIEHDSNAPPSLQDLSVHWHGRHQLATTNPTLRALLAGRLQNFQLSATQLTRFTDTSHDGPNSFLMRDLLQFPSGSSLLGTYGDAIHETLAWLQTQVGSGATLPTTVHTIAKFRNVLASKRLTTEDYEQLYERGVICLEAYQAQQADLLKPTDRSEYNFRGEGVFINTAHLSGKIDRLIIDDAAKTIAVVDFKTGRSHTRWTPEMKLLHYKQQLYFYKLLVEGSTKYRGYHVNDAYLQFVEPDENGAIQDLHVRFDDQELADFRQLIVSVWQHIQDLNFPSVSEYSQDSKGSLQFQTDLRRGDK